MHSGTKELLKWILLVVGIIAILFFIGFGVRGCADRSDLYNRQSFEKLNKQLDEYKLVNGQLEDKLERATDTIGAIEEITTRERAVNQSITDGSFSISGLIDEIKSRIDELTEQLLGIRVELQKFRAENAETGKEDKKPE